MQNKPYKPSLCPKVVPFPSFGSYCWLNALLQSMLGLSSLTELLINRKAIFKNNKVAAAYIDLCERPAADTHAKFIEVFSAAPCFAKKLKSGRQNCAEDGFTELINSFNSKDASLLCLNSYASSLYCKTCEKDIPIKRDTGLDIHMVTTVVFDNSEDFCDWIRVHENYVTDYTCQGCNSATVYQISALKALREIVVICFDGPLADQPKWFPETMKFPGVAKGSTLTYQLVAKIERSGIMPTAANNYNASSGHYWATVRRNDIWWKANDNVISQGTPSPTPETFILMYHLV